MDLIEKRSSGIGDQPSFPAAQRSHNLDGLVASPPNLQLMPIMATGEGRLPPALLLLVPLLVGRAEPVSCRVSAEG